MTWKDIFAPIGVLLTILIILNFIFGFIMMQQFKELRGEGGPIQITKISCVTDSHYVLNLKNATTKTIDSNKLNFYVDDSKVTCEGLNRLEPGGSVECKIGQLATKGSHNIEIEGRLSIFGLGKFSTTHGVRCD
jgi:cold shock CspA family protein